MVKNYSSDATKSRLAIMGSRWGVRCNLSLSSIIGGK